MTNLVDRLKQNEGERFEVYDDATGKPFRKGDALKGNLTIGVGLNIHHIDREESDWLLNHRIVLAQKDAWAVFGYSRFSAWPQNRQEVLIEMIYNLGYTRFRGFRQMISAAMCGDWVRVKAEILDSDAARELPARYQKLAELI